MSETLIRLFVLFLLLVISNDGLAQADAGPEALIKAIRARDAAAVERMLQADPALLQSRVRGATPITAALFISQRGFIDPARNEMLSALLARKPLLDIFDASGAGDVARVRELIRADRSLATAWSPIGWTPLHLAAFGGHAEIVKFLLDHGAGAQVNSRARTRFLNTPLQTALLTGQYQTAKLLLENGADPLVRQAKGFTAMHEAALLGRRDLVDLLLAHGAELNSRSDDGRTPLSEAMRGKHEQLAAFLKSKGAVAGPFSTDLNAPPE